MPIPMLHNHHMLLYIRILRNYFVGTCALEQPMLLFVHWGCSVKWRLHQESLYWLNGQKHSWPIVLMQHRVGDAHACLLQSIHRKAVWLPRLCLTVSCFPSCSITSPLTPTCGSSALWQEGLPCGGGKLKHSWLVKQAEMCSGWRKTRSVFVGVR